MHFLEQSPPVFKRSGVGLGIEDYKNKRVLCVCVGGGGGGEFAFKNHD